MTFNAHSALLWYYRRWDILFNNTPIISVDLMVSRKVGVALPKNGLDSVKAIPKLFTNHTPQSKYNWQRTHWL